MHKSKPTISINPVGWLGGGGVVGRVRAKSGDFIKE